MSNLTTLQSVKGYLGINNAMQDVVISKLIERESSVIKKYCGQNFYPSSDIKRFNGTGTRVMMVPGSPVVRVNKLTIVNIDIPESDGVSNGYFIDDNAIVLVPESYGKFPMGKANIKLEWESGYHTTDTGLVPTGNGPTVTPSNGGLVISSNNVSYANGVALTEVSSGPLVGQYSFLDGVYSFNTADANNLLTFDYFYVPGDVEQACIEAIGIDLKARDNLGVRSKSLAGESISYADSGLSGSIKEMLSQYVRRAYV